MFGRKFDFLREKIRESFLSFAKDFNVILSILIIKITLLRFYYLLSRSPLKIRKIEKMA